MDFQQPWDLGDITFVIKGRKIYVNKGVLAMSSDVFKAMFTSEFKEREMKEIPLPHKKFDDFVALMKLVHPLPNICVVISGYTEKNVEGLLPLAHEYQIHQVIKQCEKVLIKGRPCIRNLILADKFSLSELRQDFFNYLKQSPYHRLEHHPEFDMMDEDMRTEVLEYQSMYQEPCIKNLLLAEKYNKPDVYDKCMKYLKDTELAQLQNEKGFDKLRPSVLIQVLADKVLVLEPTVKMLKPQVNSTKKQLAKLKADVGYLIAGGDFHDGQPCRNTVGKLKQKHLIGTNSLCLLCLDKRLNQIASVIKNCYV